MNTPVACLDCAWTGTHKHGPIQGARCPRCTGTTIVRTNQEASK